MVLTHSEGFKEGFSCPPFSLKGVDGKTYSLADFADAHALLVAFICNHCPYVRAIEDRLIDLRHQFSPREFAMVGICSNDAGAYPEDSLSELKKRWKAKSYGFPYLLDESQEVAKTFSAVCTPDLFLFDENRKLYYHGRLDDNWQDSKRVKRHDLKNAISALLNGEDPMPKQEPSVGCSIKWKV